MKMALNNSISDRDALREQQRQARALMMDTNDSPVNPVDLFAGPIYRVSRPSDDPLGKKIQKTLGEYDTFKETISLNPKNLIGITSQPPTPSATSGGRPHFADALKPAKPPYVNGFKVSGSAPGHHNSSSSSHHNSSSSHQHRGSSSGSRSNSAVVSSRSAINGWSGQTKAPSDGYKHKGGFKPPSPPAPYPNHLGGAPPLPPPPPSTTTTTTLLPDGLSEKASKPTFHPQTLHHSSLPPTSGAKTGSSEHLVNGNLFNGVVKATHNRSVSAKPNLRVNIEEAQSKVPDHVVENILKEMIAPTPLTAIPTPRKEETKFAFSAVVAPTPLLPLPPTSTNSSPPSVPERNSVKSVSRSLEKPFAAFSAPSAGDKQQQQPVGAATHGIALSLIDDLDVSESDDDEGTSGRKACASSQVSGRSPASGHQPPISSVPPPHALPAALPVRHNSDSDNSESSSSSSSEPEPDTSDNEEEEVVVVKPASPLNVSGMNWGLDNFLVTSPTVPFGLPSESTPVAVASSDSSRSSSHRHHRSSGSAHSTNKTNVCDLGNGSRRGAGRTRELPIASDDDDAVPALLAHGTSQLASPSSRGSMGLLTSFPRNNEAFSRIIDKDVPAVFPPLSPSSPPHAPPSRTHSSASSRSTSAPHATKKRSSLSPRSRSPAAAPPSLKDFKSAPGRSSKDSNPAAKKVLFSNSNTDKYGYSMTPIEVKTKQKTTNKHPKEKLKENEESVPKKVPKPPRTPPSPSPPLPSKVSSSSKPSKSATGSSIKTEKKLADPKEAETKAKNKQKSPCGRKPKSATKYPSKAIISDDDSDIDVGGSSPVVSVSKSPAVGIKSGSQGLSKNSHFSSSTSLSSVADSVEDVSTATGTVLTAKGKHDSSSRHSTSSQKKSKTHPPPPPPTTSVKSESGGSQVREALKSKSKPNKIAPGSGSGPYGEWLHVPAPLSPIPKDDYKEAKSRVHNKNHAKFPSLVYQDGVPSLLVSLDKSLLDRLPVYPPQQLRLTNDTCAVVKPAVEEKKKSKKIPERSESPPVKVKQQQLTMAESGKENRTDKNHSVKCESKVSKRPLQEPEARKSELKKLKSSASSVKEKNSSVEGLNQFPQKTKTGSAENLVKVKKEILEVEEKGSPAARSTQSPADASSLAAEKKAKKSLAHKSSSDLKREKKHSSSNSSLPVVKKSNRESEVLSVKVEVDNSEVKTDGNLTPSASSTSGLTAQNLSKEVKQRGRSENLEVPDSKKRKWSGSNSSITSQTNSVTCNGLVTDSQKVNKTEGIERNTNHDRIVVANQDFNKSSSVSSTPNFNSSKDLVLVLNRINDIVDLSRHSQDFYLNQAKRLKHDADQEADRTTKALKYLHAVVYFSLCGIRMETDPNHSHSTTYQMFSNTTSLIKFVSSKFRSHQSTNVSSSVENKGAVLSLWCQSILNFKLYNMKRNEVKDCNNTISEYQKTPANPVPNRPGSRQMTSPCQTASSAIPPTMWNKSNSAPSPMSPIPSPANSVGSVESQSSGYSSSEICQPRSNNNALTNNTGNSHNSSSVLQQQTVSIPVHLHSTMQKQLINLGHLYWTHELWDQAESLIVRGGNQDFFTMLDEYCGKKIVNPMLSSIHDVSKHVLLGLHFLGQKMSGIS